MNGNGLLFGGDQVGNILMTLVDRQTRRFRHDERRLAELRTTKHRLKARKSCVADARRYRIAKEFPMSVAAQLDWQNLFSARRPKLRGSSWFKKFREDQLNTG